MDLARMAIERQLLYTLGSHSSDSILDLRYALTDEGRRWTIDAMQRSGYVGPAPVSLADFIERVNLQKPTNERITPEKVRNARQRARDRRRHHRADRAGSEFGPVDVALRTAGKRQVLSGQEFCQRVPRLDLRALRHRRRRARSSGFTTRAFIFRSVPWTAASRTKRPRVSGARRTTSAGYRAEGRS